MKNFIIASRYWLIVSLLLLVASLFGLVWLLSGLAGEVAGRAEKRAELASIIKSGQELDNWRQLNTTLAGQDKLISDQFLTEASINLLLDYFDQAAASNQVGLSLETIKPNTTAKPPRPSVSLALKASGTFANLIKFARLIDNAPYGVTWQQFNLEQVTDKPTEWQARGVVELITYQP